MSARLRIQHRTTATFDRPVTVSRAEVRVTPMTTPEQTALRTRLDVSPTPWTHVFHDYWGSQVTALEVHEPHGSLSVLSSSTVEVDRPPVPPPGAPWDAVRSPAVADRLVEHLAPTDATRVPAELAASVRALARGQHAHRWPDDVALAVCALVHAEVSAPPGAGAAAPAPRGAARAWAERTGSSQDLAHLALGALRSLGIPARYVSGHLHPDPGAAVGTTVRAEPRAWVEWWTGDWYGWDPSLGLAPGDRHVVLARGRCADDVPALTGTLGAGAVRADVVVTVDLTRLA